MPVMSPEHAYANAAHFIKQFGDVAEAEAGKALDEARRQGDKDAVNNWTLIIEAIGTIRGLPTKP